MTIFSRIRQTRINYLYHQFRRCYFQTTTPFTDSASSNKLSVGLYHKPNCVVHRRPGEIFDNARFFAAPVQVKKKVEEKDTNGPRLNDQIRAQSVRLVTDDGHSVVPLHVALQRAQELGQDLVEVQRDPCVVRIMDYHKERYLKKLKEKDKAKSKSEVTLRKGDNKEVRFSPKCEQKDLKMKADTAKRLMERGYRVKCMVMGTEDQDLGGMLSRFTSLIEDFAIVESGPRVERKQAYVIVRHEKFGPSKKGGKKALKAAKSDPSGTKESDLEGSEYSEAESDDYGKASSSQEPDSPSPTKHDKSHWSLGDSGNSSEKMFDYSGDSKVVHCASMEHQVRGMRQPANPLSSAQLQPEMENRYSRQGGPQVGVRQPANPVFSAQLQPGMENRYSRQGGPANPVFSAQLQPGMENRYSRQGGPQVSPNHGQGQGHWNNNRMNPDGRGARPPVGWDRGTDGQTGPRWDPRVNTKGDPKLSQVINNEAGQNARDPRRNQGINSQTGQDARDPRLNQGINNQAGQDVRDPRPAFRRVSNPDGSGEGRNPSSSYGMFSATNRNAAAGPSGSGFPQNAGSRTPAFNQGSPMSRTEGGNPDSGRWGIFSKDDTDSNAEQGFNIQSKVNQR